MSWVTNTPAVTTWTTNTPVDTSWIIPEPPTPTPPGSITGVPYARYRYARATYAWINTTVPTPPVIATWVTVAPVPTIWTTNTPATTTWTIP